MTNKKGTIKAVQPKRTEDKAVLMGWALASFAAVKAAMAMGGEIIDIRP